MFAKDVQCVHFSFSSHLPRNLKESLFHGISVPSACLTFQTWAWLKILSISRRLLLKSVMLHLWPYNCFSVVCLLLFVPVGGTCVRVTVVMTLTFFFSFFNCTVCHFWWTLDSFRCSFKKKNLAFAVYWVATSSVFPLLRKLPLHIYVGFPKTFGIIREIVHGLFVMYIGSAFVPCCLFFTVRSHWRWSVQHSWSNGDYPYA